MVGSLAAKGVFSRGMNVDLPETLPLAVRVFVVWLTVVLWKRGARLLARAGAEEARAARTLSPLRESSSSCLDNRPSSQPDSPPAVC